MLIGAAFFGAAALTLAGAQLGTLASANVITRIREKFESTFISFRRPDVASRTWTRRVVAQGLSRGA
jgi:hypothetical protein